MISESEYISEHILEEFHVAFKDDAEGFKSLFAQVSYCMAHWGHLSGKLERQQTCKKLTN